MSDDAHTLALDGADGQDLADVVCGLTAIGSYAASAGLDDDADRIDMLRRRIVRENPALARTMLAGTVVTTGADPDSFREGVRDILAGQDQDTEVGGDE